MQAMCQWARYVPLKAQQQKAYRIATARSASAESVRGHAGAGANGGATGSHSAMEGPGVTPRTLRPLP